MANENNIYRKTFDHRPNDEYNQYTYDDLDRLIDVDYLVNVTPDHEETFVMETLGNRTGDQTLTEGTVNFTVQSSTNRYTSIGGNAVSHDAAGNMEEHTPNSTKYHYEYDYENRVVLIKEETAPDTWAVVTEMDYDALGRRIRVKKDYVSSAPTVVTLFYYNPEWQVLAEYNAAGAHQRYFIYGNYIDEPVVMHRESDSEDYYYAQDHLYSVVALIDDGGSVVERYEYDAYGTVHIMDAGYNTRTVSSYGNPYTFQAHRLDLLDSNNLTLMPWRERVYNTYTARWLQQEKLGMVPSPSSSVNGFAPWKQHSNGVNLYLSLLNNPQGYADPFGLWGRLIHYTKTRVWAERVGYPHTAAVAVATADEAVDSGGTSPLPIVGDQSYHFNRNSSRGRDSRLSHFAYHYMRAKIYCNKAIDLPERAAEELGTSMHPLQDWVAHGDYAINNSGEIYIIHNSRSPQSDFGDPGGYPDDPTLDVVGSPDGRATHNNIIDLYVVNNGGGFNLFYRDFAYYEKGSKRYNLTRTKTVEELKAFFWYVQTSGGCRCKKYFGVQP